MPNQDDKEPNDEEQAQGGHPEFDSSEGLPISTTTKEAIKKLMEETTDGHQPDPEFDNDIYLLSPVQDDDYNYVALFWATPDSNIKDRGRLGEIVLYFSGDEKEDANVKYKLTQSPDGIQIEKQITGNWQQGIVHGRSQEQTELQLTAFRRLNEMAQEEEREFDLTRVSEIEGQRVLGLVGRPTEWSTS